MVMNGLEQVCCLRIQSRLQCKFHFGRYIFARPEAMYMELLLRLVLLALLKMFMVSVAE